MLPCEISAIRTGQPRRLSEVERDIEERRRKQQQQGGKSKSNSKQKSLKFRYGGGGVGGSSIESGDETEETELVRSSASMSLTKEASIRIGFDNNDDDQEGLTDSRSSNILSAEDSTTLQDSFRESSRDSPALYYFGYGPIVNRMVRERRGLGHISSETHIRTAILYDHRLKFVEGGTVNIIPSTGWDVKGILVKFDDAQEFRRMHDRFDPNYDRKSVTVQITDKHNLDPKNKNDYTAPFASGEGGGGCTTTEELSSSIGGRSCPDFGWDSKDLDDVVSPFAAANAGGRRSTPAASDKESTSSSGEDYSCPFDLYQSEKQQRSISMFNNMKESGPMDNDPNTFRAVTFYIPENSNRFCASSIVQGHTEDSAASAAASSSNKKREFPVGMPQERYLKLIAAGLRENDVDECYIGDEIESMAYVPTKRDSALTSDTTSGGSSSNTKAGGVKMDRRYRKFLGMRKVPKISYDKYERKFGYAAASLGSSGGSSSSFGSNRGGRRSKSDSLRASSSSTAAGGGSADDVYFLCGRKVLKLKRDEDDKLGDAHACVRWIESVCRGQHSCVPLVVYQTFYDPETDSYLPPLRSEDDVTEEHVDWAEHTLLLYLERGGLSAEHKYDIEGGISASGNSGGSGRVSPGQSGRLSVSMHGKSVPSMNNLLSKMKSAKASSRDVLSSIRSNKSSGSSGGGSGMLNASFQTNEGELSSTFHPTSSSSAAAAASVRSSFPSLQSSRKVQRSVSASDSKASSSQHRNSTGSSSTSSKMKKAGKLLSGLKKSSRKK